MEDLMKKNKYIYLILPIIIICSIIVGLYILDEMNIPSRYGFFSNSNSQLWLDILYTTLITLFSALLGAYATIKSVEMTIKDQDKSRKEDNRINVLPLLDIVYEDISPDYRHDYFQFDYVFTNNSKQKHRKNISDTAFITFAIKNVGQRELYDLHIANFNSHFFKEFDKEYVHEMNKMIYKDGILPLNFSFYELGSYDDEDNSDYDAYDTLISGISFDCYFKDCFNNWYKQSLSINIFHSIEKDTPLDERALNVSISKASIDSPPQLIDFLEIENLKNNGHIVTH